MSLLDARRARQEMEDHDRALAGEVGESGPAVYLRGGFSRGADHLSPHVAARVLAAEAQHYRSAAADEHARKVQQAQRQEADVMASIRMATERGEVFDMRRAVRDGGVGHTCEEFVALASGRMDLEDAQLAARERAEFRRWQEGRTADTSADTSAPTPGEVEATEDMAARIAAIRAQKRADSKVIKAARGLARLDREMPR